MKLYLVKKMLKQMSEELGDSEKYIECAIKYKDENKIIADMYSDLSAQELNHYNILRTNLVDVINKKNENDTEEVNEEIETIYNWENEKMQEEVKEIKILHDMYKGQ